MRFQWKHLTLYCSIDLAQVNYILVKMWGAAKNLVLKASVKKSALNDEDGGSQVQENGEEQKGGKPHQSLFDLVNSFAKGEIVVWLEYQLLLVIWANFSVGHI